MFIPVCLCQCVSGSAWTREASILSPKRSRGRTTGRPSLHCSLCLVYASVLTPPKSVKQCERQRSVEIKSYWYPQARGSKTGPVPTLYRSLAPLCQRWLVWHYWSGFCCQGPVNTSHWLWELWDGRLKPAGARLKLLDQRGFTINMLFHDNHRVENITHFDFRRKKRQLWPYWAISWSDYYLT